MTDKNRQHDTVCVIIRSAGERTEQVCKNLVLEQGIPEENIRLIKEVPFAKALRASYLAGIDLDCQWTFCLDADVLLLPGSIQDMVTLAEQQEDTLFEIQCLVIDKFIGGPREAGNHLYRTSLLEKALALIPEDENIIRPETHTLNAMAALGFPRCRINYLAGLHDFEQYYRDIYRKCFIQAHKHQEYAEIYLSYRPGQAAGDVDYQVAIKALADGMQYQGSVRIDIQQDIYQQYFQTLQVLEKEALDPDVFNLEKIRQMVENWKTPAVYRKYFHYDLVFPGQKVNNWGIFLSKLKRKKQEVGLIKLPFYLLGSGIEKLGKKIKQVIHPKNDLD